MLAARSCPCSLRVENQGVEYMGMGQVSKAGTQITEALDKVVDATAVAVPSSCSKECFAVACYASVCGGEKAS